MRELPPVQKDPNPYATIEDLKVEYKTKINEVLYKPLTVDNIDLFAEDALESVVDIMKNLLEEYAKNPNLNMNTSFDIKQQEDDVCKKLDLPNIPEILENIIAVRGRINDIKKYIGEEKEESEDIITPPQELSRHVIPNENIKSFEKKNIRPRLLTLLYILETDFEIDIKKISITEGRVADNMMRKKPYVRVTIPELDRVVYICDEEGNASYVFDSEILDLNNITVKDLDVEDKGGRDRLINLYPKIGVKIIQSANWRDRMSLYLNDDIPSQDTFIQVSSYEDNNHLSTDATGLHSEFIKSKWLSFDDLTTEIRRAYFAIPEDRRPSIKDWYKNERKKHTNWHSSLHTYYKDKGWNGFPELLGMKNRLKKELIPFDDLAAEVRMSYLATPEDKRPSRIKDWYKEERKKHSNWDPSPSKYYKNKGWQGWSELVGNINLLKKERLDLADITVEARELYFAIPEDERPGIKDWYKEEVEKHSNWPADPSKYYKDKGWQGWPEFMGQENILKKERLSFEDFCDEVKRSYLADPKNKIIGIDRWYKSEHRKNPQWVSNPQVYYKDKGWKGWLELLGLKGRPKKQSS
jgi:hypothetical protein